MGVGPQTRNHRDTVAAERRGASRSKANSKGSVQAAWLSGHFRSSLPGLGRWISRVWADCVPHLETPNTRLYVAVGDLLCEVAVAGRLPAREVLARALPKLLQD